MSAHRQHYMDLHRQTLQAEPAPQLATGDDTSHGGYIAGGALLLCLCIAGIASLVRYTLEAPASPPPVPYQQALAEARVEGFRAGYATATEHGCQQALLSPPLAQP